MSFKNGQLSLGIVNWHEPKNAPVVLVEPKLRCRYSQDWLAWFAYFSGLLDAAGMIGVPRCAPMLPLPGALASMERFINAALSLRDVLSRKSRTHLGYCRLCGEQAESADDRGHEADCELAAAIEACPPPPPAELDICEKCGRCHSPNAPCSFADEPTIRSQTRASDDDVVRAVLAALADGNGGKNV